MVESGYIVEYCDVGYYHELLVLVLCLISAWIPPLLRGCYRILTNLFWFARKLLRRWI